MPLSTSIIRWKKLVSGLSLGMLLWGNHATAQENVRSESPPPVQGRALTISGGISLGVYEAGYNWAFIRLLKKRQSSEQLDSQPSLRAVTGASAGAINTVLSAIDWCQKSEWDDKPPEESLLWNTWVELGWSQLMPDSDLSCKNFCGEEETRCVCPHDDDPQDEIEATRWRAYMKDDGVFTRLAFRGIHHRVRTVLESRNRFREKCRLRVGVTLTRGEPEKQEIRKDNNASQAINIRTMRSVVVMEARVNEYGLGFFTRQEDDAPLLDTKAEERIGKLLSVPTDRTLRIPLHSGPGVTSLFDIMEASSAFPVAFGPKELWHCAPVSGSATSSSSDPSSSDPSSSETCPRDHTRLSASFVDGGVFDNIPLGLAVELVEASLGAKQANLQFHYVDPAQLRNTVERQQPPRAQSRALGGFITQLGNYVDVGRQYELQMLARGGQLDGKDVILSSRYARIMGDKLGAFGAFTARPFRQYDFYAGIYDALHDLATEQCKSERGDTLRHDRCVAQRIVEEHNKLKLTEDSVASYVIRKLLRSEVAAKHNRYRGEHHPLWENGQSWVEGGREPDKLLMALVSMGGRGAAQEPNTGDLAGQFINTVQGLRKLVPSEELERMVSAHELTPDERRLLEAPEEWLLRSAAAIAARVNYIERKEQQSGQQWSSSRLLAGAADMWLRSSLQLNKKGFVWSSGGATGNYQLLPDYLSIFTKDFGIDLGWRPAVGITEHLAVGGSLIPISWWTGEYVSTSAGLFARISTRPSWWTLSAVEVGGRVSYQWWTPAEHHNWLGGVENVAFAPEAAAYLLSGKLRVGVLLHQQRYQPGMPWVVTGTVGMSQIDSFLQYLTGW